MAAGIYGLTYATTYTYRLVAINGSGTSVGDAMQFTTLNAVPNPAPHPPGEGTLVVAPPAPTPPAGPPPPPAKTCRVANVVGHTLRGASQMLRQRRCGRVATKYPARIQRRLIVSHQTPRAGTKIAPTKVVRLRYRR